MIPKICFFVIVLFISCTHTAGNDILLPSIGFYSTPDTIIDQLKKKPSGPREHFMLGLAYKEKKKFKNAIFHFANSCFSSTRNENLKLFASPVYSFITEWHFKSDLYDDAVFEIANLFSHYGEHEFSVKFIDAISKEKSILYRDAQLLKAQSLISLKQFEAAKKTLIETAPLFHDIPSLSIISIRLATALDKLDKKTDSFAEYLKALQLDEKSWQASVAASQALDLLPAVNPQLSDSDSLMLGKALYYAKKYNEAIKILTTYDSGKSNEIKIFLLKIYTRTGDSAGISRIFSLAQGNNNFMDLLLKEQADEYWKMGRKGEAVLIFQKLLQSGDQEIVRDSLQKIADYAEKNKNIGYDRPLIEYKNKYKDSKAEFYLWVLGRESIKINPHAARSYFEEYIKNFPEGTYSGHCRFWLYKFYDNTSEADAKTRILKEIILKNADSYYTWALLDNLKETFKIDELNKLYTNALNRKNHDDAMYYHSLLFFKKGNPEERNQRLNSLSNPLIDSYYDFEKKISGMKISGNSGTVKRLEKYFEIGYYAAINREIQLISENDIDRKDKYIALAFYGRKYNNHFLKAFAVLELLKLHSMKENIFLQPESTVQSLLPLGFATCVDRSSKEFAVDKNLVYSVLKAESLFNHKAISSAGATGLMQLMPPTAKGIARDLKLSEYDLYNPCLSIRFGAQYLGWLKRYFKNDLGSMVAGYNAGAGNVLKWKKNQDTTDNDTFTEFIPFIETRYYVLKTKKFLIQYRLMYGE
jgi:soluble lytic murein transglycosylase